MLTVGRNTIALREDGPAFAHELGVGDEVLCLVNGRARFIKVQHFSSLSSERLVSIMTRAGDIRIGCGVRVVASGGLRSGSELLACKDERSYGRMAGSWPDLEKFDSRDTLVRTWSLARRQQIVSRAFRRLLELSAVPGSGGRILRIGSHGANAAKQRLQLLGTQDGAKEAGPAGWSWISPGSLWIENELPRIADTADDGALVSLLSLFWRPSLTNDRLELPVELEPLRTLSLGILTCLAVPFDVTFTPRYAPLVAGLSLNGEPSAHAAVQSIREVPDADAVSIMLEVPNAYAVLGGLLCVSGAGAV